MPTWPQPCDLSPWSWPWLLKPLNAWTYLAPMSSYMLTIFYSSRRRCVSCSVLLMLLQAGSGDLSQCIYSWWYVDTQFYRHGGAMHLRPLFTSWVWPYFINVFLLSSHFLPCDCMSCNTRYSRGLSVCLSVCLPVKRVHCDETKENCTRIVIPHKRSFILVFWQEEWLVGATHCTGNDGPNWLTLLERKRRFSIAIRS